MAIGKQYSITYDMLSTGPSLVSLSALDFSYDDGTSHENTFKMLDGDTVNVKLKYEAGTELSADLTIKQILNMAMTVVDPITPALEVEALNKSMAEDMKASITEAASSLKDAIVEVVKTKTKKAK